MSWHIGYIDEVADDFKKLDGSQKIRVRKAIKKTLQNPLPRSKGGVNLTNCLEIKLRGEGLRVIYKLICTESEMLVVIIGAREDEEVYDEASERITRYRL